MVSIYSHEYSRNMLKKSSRPDYTHQVITKKERQVHNNSSSSLTKLFYLFMSLFRSFAISCKLLIFSSSCHCQFSSSPYPLSPSTLLFSSLQLFFCYPSHLLWFLVMFQCREFNFQVSFVSG